MLNPKEVQLSAAAKCNLHWALPLKYTFLVSGAMYYAFDLAFVYRGKESHAEHYLVDPSLSQVAVKYLEADEAGKSLYILVLRSKLAPVGEYL